MRKLNLNYNKRGVGHGYENPDGWSDAERVYAEVNPPLEENEWFWRTCGNVANSRDNNCH